MGQMSRLYEERREESEKVEGYTGKARKPIYGYNDSGMPISEDTGYSSADLHELWEEENAKEPLTIKQPTENTGVNLKKAQIKLPLEDEDDKELV